MWRTQYNTLSTIDDEVHTSLKTKIKDEIRGDLGDSELATKDYVDDAVANVQITGGGGDVTKLYVDREIGKINTALGTKASQTDVDSKADKNYVDTELATLQAGLDNKVETSTLANYESKAELEEELKNFVSLYKYNTELADKADVSYVDTSIAVVNSSVADKADKTQLVGLATEAYVDNAVDSKADKNALATTVNDVTALSAALATKADSGDLDDYVLTTKLNAELAKKANLTDLDSKADVSALTTKADLTYVQTELDKKADEADLAALATKTYVDGLVGPKADASDLDDKVNVGDVYTKSEVYTKAEVDAEIQTLSNSKADKTALANKLEASDLDDYASKEYVDDAIANAVPNVDFTGYATEEYVRDYVTNATLTSGSVDGEAAKQYTDSEILKVNNALANKANTADVYNKTEVDAVVAGINTALDTKLEEADLADLATKTQLTTGLAGKLNNDALNGYATQQYVTDAIVDKLDTDVYEAKVTELETAIGTKITQAALAGLATETYVDNAVTGKATLTYVDEELAKKLNVDDFDISMKANVDDVYPKTGVYNKSEIDTKLDGKADKTDLNGLATEQYVDDAVADMVLQSSQGNVDASKIYTDNEIQKVNTALADKADKADTYTKTEVDEAIANVEVDLTGYYTKAETDNKITTSLGNYSTSDEVDTKIEEALNDYTTTADLTTELNKKLNAADLDLSGLDEKLDITTFNTAKTALEQSIADVDAKADINEQAIDILTTTVGNKADTATVNAELANKANSSDVYNKTEVYTKSEVDTAISGANNYKGSSTRANLPTNNNQVGDLRIVEDENNKVVAWNGTAWADLSNVDTDLSEYATLQHVTDEVGSVTTKIGELETAIGNNETAIDNLNTSIGNKANITDVETTLDTKAAITYVDEEVQKVKDVTDGHEERLTNHATAINQQTTTITNMGTAVTGLVGMVNQHTTDIAGLTTDLATTNTNVTNLDTATLKRSVNEYTSNGSVTRFNVGGNNTGYITFSANNTTLYDIGRVYADGNYNLVFRGNNTHANTASQKAVFAGFRAGLDVQQDLIVSNNGNLTVNGINVMDKINANATAIASKANADDVYTRDEIDEKIRAASHYKGVVATRTDLPADNNTSGDIRIIQDENNLMVAWNGTSWDNLSNVDMDLSEYATTEYVDDEIASITTQVTALDTKIDTGLSTKVNIADLNTTVGELEDNINSKVDTATYTTDKTAIEASIATKANTSDLANYTTTTDLTTLLNAKANVSNAMIVGSKKAVSNEIIGFNTTNTAGFIAWYAGSNNSSRIFTIGRGSSSTNHLVITGLNTISNQYLSISNFSGGVSMDTNLSVSRNASVGGTFTLPDIADVKAYLLQLRADIDSKVSTDEYNQEIQEDHDRLDALESRLVVRVFPSGTVIDDTTIENNTIALVLN